MRGRLQLGLGSSGLVLAAAVVAMAFSEPATSWAKRQTHPRVSSILQLIPQNPRLEAQSLSYIALPDRLLVLLRSEGEFSQRTVQVSRERLLAAVRAAYRLCANPESPERAWQAATRELARYMVEPVEDELTSSEPVMISLDSVIESAPLAALPLRSGEPFGERFAVRLAPNDIRPRVQAAILDSDSEPARKLLAVGISIAAGENGMLPLPDAAAEAEEAAAHFVDSEVLINRNASLDRVLADISRAGVFHFAGHARRTAEGTALVIGDQQLHASELAHRDLTGCRLAVLSACATASWAPVLIGSGAGGVLATRWELDSTAARLYTRAFYDGLSAGEDPAAAARAALAELRRTPGFEHPYYWAAYQFFAGAAIPRRQDTNLLAGGGKL